MIKIKYTDNDNQEQKLSFYNKDEFEIYLLNNEHIFPKILESYNYSLINILNIISVGFLTYIMSKFPNLKEQFFKDIQYDANVFFKKDIVQNILKMSGTIDTEKHYSNSEMSSFASLEDFLKFRILNMDFIHERYFDYFNNGTLFQFAIKKQEINILKYLTLNNKLNNDQIKLLLSKGFFNNLDYIINILENYTSNEILEFYFLKMEVSLDVQKFLLKRYPENRLKKLYQETNKLKDIRVLEKLENNKKDKVNF